MPSLNNQADSQTKVNLFQLVFYRSMLLRQDQEFNKQIQSKVTTTKKDKNEWSNNRGYIMSSQKEYDKNTDKSNVDPVFNDWFNEIQTHLAEQENLRFIWK